MSVESYASHPRFVDPEDLIMMPISLKFQRPKRPKGFLSSGLTSKKLHQILRISTMDKIRDMFARR